MMQNTDKDDSILEELTVCLFVQNKVSFFQLSVKKFVDNKNQALLASYSNVGNRSTSTKGAKSLVLLYFY